MPKKDDPRLDKAALLVCAILDRLDGEKGLDELGNFIYAKAERLEALIADMENIENGN